MLLKMMSLGGLVLLFKDDEFRWFGAIKDDEFRRFGAIKDDEFRRFGAVI